MTQITLGAAVGQTVLGKKVGNKALLWGALVATVPDLDVVPGYFMETVARIAFHRGPTHSLIFCLLVSPALGQLIGKIHQKESVGRWSWTKLSFWSLFTHALLDCFTTWGTQLFWPLKYRVTIKSIFVIDPLYTLPLLICVIWLLFKHEHRVRQRLNTVGLALSSFYLLITLMNKALMNRNFEDILKSKNISYLRYDTRPTPFNNLLWTANVETENGFYIGDYSFLDDHRDVPFFYFKKNHQLLTQLKDHPKIKELIQITNGYYTVQRHEKGVTINDLRFGQKEGSATRTGDFVFSYTIEFPQNDGNHSLAIRRQRTAIKLDKLVLKRFWQRIKGVSLAQDQ